jgi:hypothetical protein
MELTSIASSHPVGGHLVSKPNNMSGGSGYLSPTPTSKESMVTELNFYFRYHFAHKTSLDSSRTAGICGEIEARLTELSSIMSLCTPRARKLQNCIRRIHASQILHGVAIQQVECHGDWDIHNLFAYSQLLLESILLFKQWSKETRDAALDAAWFICQFRALVRVSSQFSYQHESKALFMAGLVLNEVEFSEGFLISVLD